MGSQKSAKVSYNSQLVAFYPRRAHLVLRKFYVVADRRVMGVTEPDKISISLQRLI